MNREPFEARYSPLWRQLEATLDELDAGKTGPDHDRFPDLYRQACHHLALARHRHYGSDLTDRLDTLVLRGHQHLYRASGLRALHLVRFALDDFPRLVRAEGRLVLLCLGLLFVPFVVMGLAVAYRPELALTLLDGGTLDGFARMYGPDGSLKAGRQVDSDFLMFGFYIYNNIGWAFRTFAGGILLGVGSIFVLVFNGLVFGAVAGYVQQAGYGPQFWPFVIGHGSFELVALVLSGVAGLRMGLSLLVPGRRTRLTALRKTAGESVRVLYGAGGMLVVAAFLEAFWSSAEEVAAPLKVCVGALLWVLVALWLTVLGRRRAA